MTGATSSEAKVIAVEEKDENENTDWCEVKPRRVRTKSMNTTMNADASLSHEIAADESEKVISISRYSFLGFVFALFPSSLAALASVETKG